jgi:hypothetical protein
LLSALDTSTLIGLSHHPKISDIMNWFENHKQENGIYQVHVMAGAKYKDVKYWITLQYLIVLNRLNHCG